MLDPQTQQAIDDRVGSFDQVATGDASKGPDEARDVLWSQWKSLTFELQEQGIAPTALCEASNEIASVRAERRSYGDTATASAGHGEQPVG